MELTQRDTLDSVFQGTFPPLHDLVELSGSKVLSDLQWLLFECSQRCMSDAVKWASEAAAYCADEMFDEFEASEEELLIPENPVTVYKENRHVIFGRSLLGCQELQRATSQFQKVKDQGPVTKFLYYWSRYLAAVRCSLENSAESIERRGSEQPPSTNDKKEMSDLHTDLLKEREVEMTSHSKKKKEEDMEFDLFLEYLLGRVELSLDHSELAITRFTNCIKKEPRFWPAYECLISRISSEQQVEQIAGKRGANKENWMQYWFEAQALATLNCQRESMEAAYRLAHSGMQNQPMLLAHIAHMKNELFENEGAIELFTRLSAMEPCRLDKMDRFAEALFVTGRRVELCRLAHQFFRTHKYKWETCLIVSNYYALRADHEASIRFLQRALRLNPYSSRCWTLIGHEFMELKNTAGACLAYRKAVAIDPRDHSGYYGLGSMYDILKMPAYALQYFQLAHQCRPQDSRMLVALGEVYTRLGKKSEAEQCFLKAYKVGDVEGNALVALARLYQSEGQLEDAMRVYEKYLNLYNREGGEMDDTHLPGIYLFLAKYYLEKDLESATLYASKCTDYDSVRDAGALIQRQVVEKRVEQSKNAANQTDDLNASDMVVEDNDSSLNEDSFQ